MKNEEIKLGMEVVLNSGGPAMTIVEILSDNESVICSWRNSENDLSRHDFKIVCLRKYIAQN